MAARARASSTASSQGDSQPGGVDTGEAKVASIDASRRGATFVLREEDHTLGNALRYAAMRDEEVAAAAYTVPHPLEKKVHLRIEMAGDDLSPADGLRRAAEALAKQCDAALDKLSQAHEAWVAKPKP